MHMSAAPQQQLRHAVNAVTGIPESDVAAAQLAALTPDGVRLTWIDARGFHELGLRFRHRIRTDAQLHHARQVLFSVDGSRR